MLHILIILLLPKVQNKVRYHKIRSMYDYISYAQRKKEKKNLSSELIELYVTQWLLSRSKRSLGQKESSKSLLYLKFRVQI